MVQASRNEKRLKRHFRARKKLFGSTERPRLVITRTNKHICAQVVNDEESKTLCAVSSYSKDLKETISMTEDLITKKYLVRYLFQDTSNS